MDPFRSRQHSANGLIRYSNYKTRNTETPRRPQKLAVYAGRVKITNRNRNPNPL